MNKQLNQKQKLFCHYYVAGFETCGNGVQSYAKAYGYNLADTNRYQSAKANANRLLNTPKINSYIEQLFEEKSLTDSAVDSQLDFLIRQNANLPVKLQAINTYYRFRSKKDSKEDFFVGAMSKQTALLASRYIDFDTWKKEHGHMFTPTEIEEVKVKGHI